MGANVENSANSAKVKAADTYNAASDHFDDSQLAFWDLYGGKTVERLGLERGSSVLDVGCGSGASALPAARAVGSGGHVMGVDLAERLLGVARAKVASQSLQNIEFQIGDMENLGFPDGHFDAVVSVFSIFFVPDMEKQVRELWRMVRPGGKLAITTWGPRLYEPVYSEWWKTIQKECPDLYSANNPWDRITDPESLRQLLCNGGVAEAEVVPEGGKQAMKSPEDWWTIALGSGLRWTIDKMGSEVARRVRESNLRWIKENGVDFIETNVIYAVADKI